MKFNTDSARNFQLLMLGKRFNQTITGDIGTNQEKLLSATIDNRKSFKTFNPKICKKAVYESFASLRITPYVKSSKLRIL